MSESSILTCRFLLPFASVLMAWVMYDALLVYCASRQRVWAWKRRMHVSAMVLVIAINIACAPLLLFFLWLPALGLWALQFLLMLLVPCSDPQCNKEWRLWIPRQGFFLLCGCIALCVTWFVN